MNRLLMLAGELAAACGGVPPAPPVLPPQAPPAVAVAPAPRACCVCGPGCTCEPNKCPNGCPVEPGPQAAAPAGTIRTDQGRLIRWDGTKYVFVDEPAPVAHPAPAAAPAPKAPRGYRWACDGKKCVLVPID